MQKNNHNTLFIGGPLDGLIKIIPPHLHTYIHKEFNSSQFNVNSPLLEMSKDYSTKAVNYETHEYREQSFATKHTTYYVMVYYELEDTALERLLEYYRPNCTGVCKPITKRKKMYLLMKELSDLVGAPFVSFLHAVGPSFIGKPIRAELLEEHEDHTTPF